MAEASAIDRPFLLPFVPLPLWLAFSFAVGGVAGYIDLEVKSPGAFLIFAPVGILLLSVWEITEYLGIARKTQPSDPRLRDLLIAGWAIGNITKNAVIGWVLALVVAAVLVEWLGLASGGVARAALGTGLGGALGMGYRLLQRWERVPRAGTVASAGS
jgi:hypothetical protein